MVVLQPPLLIFMEIEQHCELPWQCSATKLTPSGASESGNEVRIKSKCRKLVPCSVVLESTINMLIQARVVTIQSLSPYIFPTVDPPIKTSEHSDGCHDFVGDVGWSSKNSKWAFRGQRERKSNSKVLQFYLHSNTYIYIKYYRLRYRWF